MARAWPSASDKAGSWSTRALTQPMILRAGAQAGLADGAQPVQRLADQLGVAGDAVGGVQLLQLGVEGAPVGAKAFPIARAATHPPR